MYLNPLLFVIYFVLSSAASFAAIGKISAALDPMDPRPAPVKVLPPSTTMKVLVIITGTVVWGFVIACAIGAAVSG